MVNYIRFQCPSCSARIRARDDKSGRSARCKRCGGMVTVPAAISLFSAATFSGEDAERNAWRAVLGSPAVPPTRPDSASPTAPVRPGEPWYFRWVEGYAELSRFLAFGLLGVGLVLALLYLVFSAGPSAALSVAVGAVVASAGILLSAALLMLLLDIARSLRAIRGGKAGPGGE
jgi:predicted Zn finger-like uncharacterized protein